MFPDPGERPSVKTDGRRVIPDDFSSQQLNRDGGGGGGGAVGVGGGGGGGGGGTGFYVRNQKNPISKNKII